MFETAFAIVAVVSVVGIAAIKLYEFMRAIMEHHSCAPRLD
jgi:hypothetical protein